MKKYLFILILLVTCIFIIACSFENTPVSSENPTPTRTPDIPPYLVRIEGVRYIAWTVSNKNFESDIAGEIISYTGDIYNLPEEDNYTNFEPYVGCKYSKCGDDLYLYYNSQWHHLEKNSNY